MSHHSSSSGSEDEEPLESSISILIEDETHGAGTSSAAERTNRTSSSSGGDNHNDTTLLADGELRQLMESANEDSAPLPPRIEMAITREISVESHLKIDSLTDQACYGHPLSVAEAQALMPVVDDDEHQQGLIWHAWIIPDDFLVHGKLKRGLNARDFDLVHHKIKPRRPSLPVTARDFFSSLTKIPGPAPGQSRYIFHGLLNGWPALRTLELISLQERRSRSSALVLPTAKELLTGQILWMKTWSSDDEGLRSKDPSVVVASMGGTGSIYRATLRGAPWTGVGWSREAPGFCFWYETIPRGVVSHGTQLLHQLLDPTAQCVSVHMLSHRYAVATRETPRDMLTYHSLCLLEWDHGRYCTVAEAAYLNGQGGYKGKVNWYHDRDEPVTAFYKCLPPEMVAPWKTSRAEIRMYDVESKNLSEFQAYVRYYSTHAAENNRRFIDPHFTCSYPVRLSFRSKAHIAQYVINYIRRDSKYELLSKNCQTFAADLCSFLAGKKDIVPFHPVNRIEFQPRNHLFLYDSGMYEVRNHRRSSVAKKK